MKLEFIDVRRAYFHAKSRRTVYVELPKELAEEGKCGKLEKSMYGTRDAAQNWEVEYSEWLQQVGFTRGKASPCAMFHPRRNLRLVVHGDDFTLLGAEEDLDWFKGEIVQKFEVKFRGRIGPGVNDQKSIKILNRVVEWTEEGLVYEADQRHAEIIADMVDLKKGSKGVCTPGAKMTAAEIAEEQANEKKKLSDRQTTAYRACVARGNYLAQDRSDIGFAVKELSRRMSEPTEADWEALKKLGRYLVDKSRCIVKFPYQDEVKVLTTWSDTDFAGCKRTRRSTSGGVAQIGEHCVKTWSQTQAVVAMSSGEAEYYGMVRASSVGLGLIGVLEDLGVKLKLELKTDASAAKGIAQRLGLGKVRHLEVSQLWLQQKVANGEIRVIKVPGGENRADALTKYVSREVLEEHIRGVGGEVIQGRHGLMPQVGS